MAILEVSVVPLGTGSPGLSTHLARLPGLLAASGLRYAIHPMGTVIEGPLPALLALAAKLHESAFEGGCQRVLSRLAIDDRRDVDHPMEDKVRRLEAVAERG